MRSLTLGQVRGIDVKLHPTFGLVALWVVYQWGVVEGGGIGSISFGAVVLACVFLFVLLHELGHSLMAQHFGIRVRDITLVPFGGIARVEHVPSRPGWEALIAIAGPAINVAIAAALLPVVVLVGVIRGHTSAGDFVSDLESLSPTGLVTYLFLTNVMIVLFNLLPAFPMDGGRLVRAGLTHLIGRERATRIAVTLGMVTAGGMAIIGIWWHEFTLPLVAAFVIVAAYAEGRVVRLEESMRRLRVGQFAVWDRGVAASDPLPFAMRGGPRDVVVTEGGKVVGVVWRRDLLQMAHGSLDQRTVADMLDRDVFTVDTDDSVFDVQQQMQRANQWAVPVTENGAYRGIFTADRFIHVYRHLNAMSPERRGFRLVAGAVGDLLRAWGR